MSLPGMGDPLDWPIDLFWRRLTDAMELRAEEHMTPEQLAVHRETRHWMKEQTTHG